jgi:2-succinyl-6-hydroxy-2,4-cyclohexadiene-1-carboxylate synthase
MLPAENNIHIHFEKFNLKNPASLTLIFLHGFSGSSNDWQKIIKLFKDDFQCILIDLIGHGKSSSPENVFQYNSDSVISQISSVTSKLRLEKVILVGYSMGGRAALSYAIPNNEIVKGLILESTTPGIIDESERKERMENDEKLADLIEKDGIEKFIDYWMNLPIFESQKKLPIEKLKEVRKNKLKNNITGISNSLRGFGQGVMPHLWGHLAQINFDVLLITGELDLKYSLINSQILKKIKKSEHKIIMESGHNIHLEKPEVFVTLIKDFVMKF